MGALAEAGDGRAAVGLVLWPWWQAEAGIHTAGIQLLDDGPGYRRFRIAPQPGGRLEWTEAVHDSPYGRIESSWRIDGDRLTLTVTIPPGTSAEIALPDGSRTDAGPGNTTLGCRFSPT